MIRVHLKKVDSRFVEKRQQCLDLVPFSVTSCYSVGLSRDRDVCLYFLVSIYFLCLSRWAMEYTQIAWDSFQMPSTCLLIASLSQWHLQHLTSQMDLQTKSIPSAIRELRLSLVSSMVYSWYLLHSTSFAKVSKDFTSQFTLNQINCLLYLSQV